MVTLEQFKQDLDKFEGDLPEWAGPFKEIPVVYYDRATGKEYPVASGIVVDRKQGAKIILVGMMQ